MAAQWQANPTYSSSPTPQWIQDAEFSDLESVQPSVALVRVYYCPPPNTSMIDKSSNCIWRKEKRNFKSSSF